MIDNPYIIRNFQLMKHIFDNTDLLVTYYKLTKKDISITQELCMKHNSFKLYIEYNPEEYKVSRKSFYRAIDRLENKNILNVISRPRNQHSTLQVYFTIEFIKRVCDEDFANLYEQWLAWRKSCILEGD